MRPLQSLRDTAVNPFTVALTPQQNYEAFHADDTQLGKGFAQGVSGISQGSFANQALQEERAAGALRAAGTPDAVADAKWQATRDIALDMQAEQAYRGPRVKSLRDIGGVGDAVDYGLGAIGSGVATMAPSLALALATRGRSPIAAYGGAAAGAYGMEKGEAVMGQYSDPQLAAVSADERDTAATGKGVINAALEAIVPAGVAGAAFKAPAGSLLGSVGREALTEGLTEVAQTGVGFGAEKYLGSDKQLDPWDVADSFAAGALTGGAVSAVGRGPSYVTPSARLREASKTSSDPAKAIRAAFGSTQDDAEADMLPDEQDPTVLAAADPAAALQQRDQERAARVATYAQEMLDDPATPEAKKAEIAALNGDFSNEAVGDSIRNSYVAQNTGKKIVEVVDNFFGKIKDLAGVKNNLQEIPDAPIAPLVDLLAQRLGPMAEQAPTVARQLLAATSKYSATGTITPPLAARLKQLSSVVGDDTIDMISKITGNEGFKSTMTKIRNIPSATSDLGEGTSFFESLLANPLPEKQKLQLAEYVDDLGLKLGNLNKTSRENRLAVLAPFFGSPEKAKIVTEYYGGLRRAAFDKEATENKLPDDRPKAKDDVRYQEDMTQTGKLSDELNPDTATEFGALTEKGAAPEPTYKFADAKSMRPFRAFASRGINDGDGRRRHKESTIAAMELKRNSPDGARVRPVKMSEYVEQAGLDPSQEVWKIREDIESRIKEHEARGGREKQIGELKGELGLIDHTFGQAGEKGGANGVLGLYETLQVSQIDKNDLRADDDTVAKYAGLLGKTKDPKTPNTAKGETRESIMADNNAINSTKITFLKKGGGKVSMSAESMWKAQGDKEGSGKGEPSAARMKRLFSEAVASVLDRPEMVGIAGAEKGKLPKGLVIDRASGTTLDKFAQSQKRSDALAEETHRRIALGHTSVPGRRAALRDRMDEFEGLVNTAKDSVLTYEYQEEMDQQIEPLRNAADKHLRRARELMERYKAEGDPAVRAKADFERSAYEDIRDTLEDMEGMRYEAEAEMRELEKSGTPGMGMSGGVGKTKLPRTVMNEQLGENTGPRYYEEDTGLGVGKDALVSTPASEKLSLKTKPVAQPAKKASAAWQTPAGSTELKPTRPIKKPAELLVPNKTDSDRDPSAKEADYTGAKHKPKPKVEVKPDAAAVTETPLNQAETARFKPGFKDKEPARVPRDHPSMAPTHAELDAKEAARPYSDTSGLPKIDSPKIPNATPYVIRKARAEAAKLMAGTKRERTKNSLVSPNAAPTPMTAKDKFAIRKEMRRILGPKVKVSFKKFLAGNASGSYTLDKKSQSRLIQISINAANPMGVAWHEGLHDFFAMLGENPASRSIKQDLIDASNAPHVKTQLEKHLAKHPAALEQIKKSPEERVAYMYQFWAEGLLNLGPTGTGIFNKLRQFFRDMLGLISAEERAVDLLTALHKGKFADPSVVADVLADMPASRFVNKMDMAAPVINDTLKKLFNTAPDRLRAFNNDNLNTLADKFSSESGRLGFIQNRFQQEGIWTNKFAKILVGTTAQQRRAAVENMQAMKDPSNKLEQDISDLLTEMHHYMKVQSGVKTFDEELNRWVPLRQVKNYFPRYFDADTILKDPDGFAELLKKHGNFNTVEASELIKTLTSGTGQVDLVEDEHSLGYTPWAKSVNARRLKFIKAANAAEFAKYQNKDLTDILSGYIKQGVHRAEYAKEFGNGGKQISDLIEESGITDAKELTQIKNTIQGLEGTLGSEMSSSTKELMSSVMTLQNLVIMPMVIFSQLVDPIYMAARTGKLRDAGTAYVAAAKRLFGNKVDGEDMAETLGIVAQDSVLEAMGTAFGVVQMSKTSRYINQQFFKYNGLTGWNNSMRIAATAIGAKYLIDKKMDKIALAELGLKPSDIRLNSEGKLDTDSAAIKQAMFRFVDQSVLRPSASSRPVWMSDPKWILFAHLKQFTFAMHNVILKRATAQMQEGNMKPWAVLLMAMPIAMAASVGKFAITGNVPGWGFMDYLKHAVERSGLLGISDFGDQSLQDAHRGNMPGESLFGPTFGHLMTVLRWIGGDARTDFGDVVDRTVPGAKFL